jgi:hypothetical protein
MHNARNSYTQYVSIGYRLLGRYLDKAYNSVPGGVDSNPPHGISNIWAILSLHRYDISIAVINHINTNTCLMSENAENTAHNVK